MWPRALLGVLVIAMLTPVSAAASVKADLDDVRDERKQAAAELRDLLSDIEVANAVALSGEAEVERLEVRRRQLATRRAALERDMRNIVRAAVVHGSVSDSMSMLASGQTDEAVDRAQILDALTRRDKSAAEAVVAADRERTRLAELIAARVAVVRGRRSELEQMSREVSRRLDDLRADERKLAERERRARQAAGSTGAVSSGGYACIQASPYSFIDSWGNARSGGRRHEGTDVMAAHGNNVYAFTAGRISQVSTGGLGGITLWLRGNDGTSYYYAHLSGYASGIAEGTVVQAGQLVAFNGNSGNAAGTPPHVHFEAHPGGGGAVNPYSMLRAVCP